MVACENYIYVCNSEFGLYIPTRCIMLDTLDFNIRLFYVLAIVRIAMNFANCRQPVSITFAIDYYEGDKTFCTEIVRKM